MPPATGADVLSSTDQSMAVQPQPLTPKHSQAQRQGKQRILIAIYESNSNLSGKASHVLSTFVDSSLKLDDVRSKLADIAKAQVPEFHLAGRDWKFVYGVKSPVTGEAVFYNVPRGHEEEETALDFGPVLLVKLDPKPKTKEQTTEDTTQGFEVDDIETTSCGGQLVVQKAVILHPHSNPRSFELLSKLKTIMRTESALFDQTPKIPLHKLFTVFASLKTHEHTSEQMRALVKVVQELKQEELDKMSRLQEDGSVTFEYLQYYFSPGTKILTGRRGIPEMKVGGKVESTRYVNTWCGSYFDIKYNVIKSDGKRFYLDKEHACVPSFTGTKPLSQLPVRILSSDDEAKLSARGRNFSAYGLGNHYLQYAGNVIKETWCGPHFTRAHGRVMVDVMSYERINPNSRYSQDSADHDTLSIDENMFYMCWPTLLGFSFAAKKWGEIDLSLVSAIAFDAGAFEALVLADDKKTLIKSLVDNYQTSFADVISGKGGGCIFLLHGQPGTGKTLTAEAVSEQLHRPLYSVSVGELGTNTSELESSLRQILEVASSWNAVVLLDEADIFLEKRTDHDVARNAMVGIFLRLLEYHQGILFLTTNRVKSFDSAFHSRISVALRYPDLDQPQRQKVWSNLLAAAGIARLDAGMLSTYELNGRQIKTTIRLAQALALKEGSEVLPQHVEQTVAVAQQFCDDLASANT